jgi:hypothetical protein
VSYTTVLVLHSLLRWVVLGLAVAIVLRSLSARGGAWTAVDDKLSRGFVTSLDAQFLIGLVLYIFLSPFSTAAFEDFGGAMRQSGLRLWALEHPVLTLLAVAFGHVGRAGVRKAASDAAKHRKALIFTTASLVAMILAIPWPGMANGRPLVRFN